MANLKINNIMIEYEAFGEPSNPTLLLIAGLSGQMLFWPSDFCARLASNGYHVIRFDNRDTGLSTQFHGLEMNEIKEKIGALFMGKKASVPYTLEDMAEDCVGILDGLDIHKAHICGMSMGGHIAQILCLKHPSRVLSLICLYSHPGNKERFMPTQKVMDALFTPVPDAREEYIKHQTDFFELISGTGRPFDENFHKNLIGKSYDRCLSVEGTARQYLAILKQTDRTADLNHLNIPTLVIHGDDDPMISLAGGEAIADAIPNSEIVVIKGMGHALPDLNSFGLDILESIVSHMNEVKV